jgi:hypothetical protein
MDFPERRKPMAKSTLEKLVTKKVANTKKTAAEKAAKEAKELAEFQAKLPKNFEERCKLIYPSITDGDEWKVYFDAGHWRLAFEVGKLKFEIHDVYIPEDRGTPTEGDYGHDAYWAPYLFVASPPLAFVGVEQAHPSLGEILVSRKS